MDPLPQQPDDHRDSPIRRDTERDLRAFGDGPPFEEAARRSAVTLNDGGCIESDGAKITRTNFYHCGHPTTEAPGNQCMNEGCANVSCHRCEASCCRCLKPLCKECRTQVQEQGLTLVYCGRCLADAQRGRLKRIILKALIGPFIEEDKR